MACIWVQDKDRHQIRSDVCRARVWRFGLMKQTRGEPAFRACCDFLMVVEMGHTDSGNPQTGQLEIQKDGRGSAPRYPNRAA